MPRLSARSLLLAAVVLAASAWPATAAESVTGAPSSEWRKVEAGPLHTCGIRTSGHLFCWGRNGFGQLGIGAAGAHQATPVEVSGNDTDWVQVSAGEEHTCGRRATGQLFCWGSDGFGQLGNGAGGSSQTPVEVSGQATDWVQVSAGRFHTCGVRASGFLFCWGRNWVGVLGDDSGLDRHSPVPVAGGQGHWVGVSSGGALTCGRKESGRVFCWGNDFYGGVGDGWPAADRPRPTLVAGGWSDWRSVKAGGTGACGLRAGGRIFCWGDDTYGQVGDGFGNRHRFRPVAVRTDAGPWVEVAVGSSSSCARSIGGRLFCWGSDRSGQLGDGDPQHHRGVPVEVFGRRTDWVDIAVGGGHGCGRTAGGVVHCWGWDRDGQLGDGDADEGRNAPGPVL